jgi:hypothetical protein
LPQTVTLNTDAGKPPRRPHLWQTVMLNLIQHLLIQHLQIRIHSADSESSSE